MPSLLFSKTDSSFYVAKAKRMIRLTYRLFFSDSLPDPSSLVSVSSRKKVRNAQMPQLQILPTHALVRIFAPPPWRITRYIHGKVIQISQEINVPILSHRSGVDILGSRCLGHFLLKMPCRGLSFDGSTLRVDGILLLLAVHHSGLMHISHSVSLFQN